MRRWLGVAASAIAAHLTALGAGFVWLDHAHVEGGLAIAPPSRFLSLFRGGFAGTGYYRPLMALSLSVDALAGTPLVFHATSLVCHAGAALLTVAAAEALGLARRAALFAGVLFAVHPITVLVADTIAFRSEALVTAALLALVWAHLKRNAAVAALAVLMGCLTKETAFALAPIFVLALEIPRAGPRGTAPWWSHLAGKGRLFGAEAVAFAAALALRTAFAPAWRASHPALSPSAAAGTRLAALAKSVAALVLPVDRSICDAFVVTPLVHMSALAGALALAAIAWAAWKKRGVPLLFAVALLPSLQLLPVMRWWSPHYLYLPLAFLAMIAGQAVSGAVTRYGRPALYATGGALLLLGVVSFCDGGRFADDALLWTPEVRVQPACREGQFYLGEVARRERRWDDAAQRYEASLAEHPNVLAYVDRGAALQNLGTVRLEQRRFGAARAAFLEALGGTRDAERQRELTYDLAVATLQGGDPLAASRLLETETSRGDALTPAILVRALALDALGRADEAQALRERVRARK